MSNSTNYSIDRDTLIRMGFEAQYKYTKQYKLNIG